MQIKRSGAEPSQKFRRSWVSGTVSITFYKAQARVGKLNTRKDTP